MNAKVKTTMDEIRANCNMRKDGVVEILERDLGRIIERHTAGEQSEPPLLSVVKPAPPCLMYKMRNTMQIKSELIRQVEFREEGKELFVYECYFIRSKGDE